MEFLVFGDGRVPSPRRDIETFFCLDLVVSESESSGSSLILVWFLGLLDCVVALRYLFSSFLLAAVFNLNPDLCRDDVLLVLCVLSEEIDDSTVKFSSSPLASLLAPRIPYSSQPSHPP